MAKKRLFTVRFEKIGINGMNNSSRALDKAVGYREKGQRLGFRRMLESIVAAGKGLLSRTHKLTGLQEAPAEALTKLCQQLLEHRGEASGLALASEILAHFESLLANERIEFFELINEQFEADPNKIMQAADAYRKTPCFDAHSKLAKAVESPRQKLFRRLNMAPDGTLKLVRMRGYLLKAMQERSELRAIDADLRHLFIAWFNRGFLTLERIDWNSPASVLEKIVAYEAVHEIDNLEDLRTRLADDRRCFAFFHPAMPADPLIFVQIALTEGLAKAITPIIAPERELTNPDSADTAVFYSITNCHNGLRGISFGNFLLKQVIEELRHDSESISQFVTLSPIPHFSVWLKALSIEELPETLHENLHAALEILQEETSPNLLDISEHKRAMVIRLCAFYLINEKLKGEPVDPVARFHLSNGAALENINWGADPSPAGIKQSIGVMVNYVYQPKNIEKNHESYFADGKVVTSTTLQNLTQTRH